MARCTAILPVVAVLIVLAVGTDAQAGYVYNKTDLTRGMTPLTAPTIIWPPTQTYQQTTQTRGMTALTGDTTIWSGTAPADDASFLINIGFSFQFYGNTYTQAYVSSNGFITFNANSATSLSNSTLPNATAPNDVIALFWDDLYVYSGTSARVSYRTQGTAPNRTLTVQYWMVPHYVNSGYLTGQIILTETSNQIDLCYDNSLQSWISCSASIGIENSTGTSGIQVTGTPSINSVPATNFRYAPQSPSYDDQSSTINIGFAFQYYSSTYTQAIVSTNGFLTFTSAGDTDATNDSIPDANNVPDNYIALFWDDLIVASNGVTDRVQYEVTGSSPNRVFIVEYYGVTRSGQPGSELTGQIALFETSNRIELRYDNTAANNVWTGVDATIGIEDATGSSGVGGPGTGNTISTLPANNYRFDLTVTHNLVVTSAQGSPTPTVGTHAYASGSQVVTSSNSPASGTTGVRYVCVGYTGTGSVPSSGTASSLTFTIAMDSTITWLWTTEYFVTLQANPGAGGNPIMNPTGPWFTPGTLVTIYANPNTGYMFNSWSGGVTSINNPETITVNGPLTVTANYIPPPSSLTVSGNPSQYGTPVPPYGTHTYSVGSGITCSVTSPVSGPTGERYLCTGWSGTGDVPSSGTGTSVTFTFNGTSTITWNWVVEYQLTLQVNNATMGSAVANPPGPWILSGTPVTVTANPTTGYQFTDWSGAVVSTNNPETFTITAPSTVTANFSLPQIPIDVASAQGNCSPAAGTHSFDQGSQVVLTATSPVSAGPGARYRCTGWTGTGDVPASGTATSVTVTLNQASTITWTWVTEFELSVTSDPTAGGTVSLSPPGGWYVPATVVTLTPQPSTSYTFQDWGGALSGSNSPETVTMASSSVSVVANFLAQGPSLTVVSAYGFPTPAAGSRSYPSGTPVDCSVSTPVQGGPGTRYVCTGWIGTGSVPVSGTGTNLLVTLTTDSTLTWVWEVQHEVTTAVNPTGVGTIARSPDLAWYPSGTALTLTASPVTGDRFFAWSGGFQSLVNPATLIVDGPKNVTANFVGAMGLGVAAGPANPVASSELVNTTGVPMLQIALLAGSSEGMDVSSIRISVTGSSDESVTVQNAHMFVDTDGDGIFTSGVDTIFRTGVGFIFDEGTATFTGTPVRVAASGVVTMLVTFDFNAAPGDDFRVFIADNSDIVATGVVSSLPVGATGAPVTGGVKTTVAPASPGSLEIYPGVRSPGPGMVDPGAANVNMGQITLRAGSVEGLTVSSLALSALGTGHDAAGVLAVRLYRDTNGDGGLDGGDVLLGSSGPYGSDNGVIAFTGLSESIAAGTQLQLLVAYDFTGGAPIGSYCFGILKDTDVTALGATSAVTLAVSGPPVNGRVIMVSARTGGGSAEYVGLVSTCGGPGFGGIPLLPLLPFALALWVAARRRKD